jgi:MFS family permease
MTEPTVRTAVKATLITMGLHALCTVAMIVPGLLAPVAAADFGADPSRVGVIVAVIYVGIIPASLASGRVIARFGDLGAGRFSGWLCALSMLLAALAGWGASLGDPASRSLLAGAAIVIVLFASGLAQGLGYGVINPVGSQILFRATPAAIRSFVFSVKQSAVPIGQMIAGLAIPSLLLFVGWQVVVFVVALMIVAYTVAMAYMRLETAEGPAKAASGPVAPFNLRGAIADFIAPARIVWANPELRDLAWVGVLYSVSQLCLTSFLVSYLNLEVGLSLVLAGSLFSASQFGGMIGRVTWGFVADRWVTPRVQLGALGVIGGVCGLLTTFFSPQWPLAGIAVVSLVYGASAASWNGVYFAEVARLCPQGEVGRMTGGLQFYMSVGAGIGPLLFSALVGAAGSYAPGFALSALPGLVIGVMIMRRRHPVAAG